MKFTNWKDFLITAAVSNRGEEGNKIVRSYGEISSSKKSGDEKARALTEDPEAVLLFVDDENKLKILHNLIDFGGVRTRPEHKVIGLFGLTDKADAVVINEDLWEIPVTVRVPDAKELLECTLEEDWSQLEPHPTSRSNTFVTLRGVIPPPFLAATILDLHAEGKDLAPWSLSQKIIEDSKKFDELHKEDEEYKESLVQNISYLIRFLWAVSKNGIPNLEWEHSEGDAEVNSHLLNCHCRHIMGGKEAFGFVTEKSSNNDGRPNFPALTKRGISWGNATTEPSRDDVGSPISFDPEPSRGRDQDDLEDEAEEILKQAMQTKNPTFELDENGVAIGGESSALRMSAVVMSRLSDSLIQSNRLKAIEIRAQNKRETEKKDRTTDFHESTIGTIKNVGAIGSVALTSIPDSAKRFFNAKTVGKADQELITQFEDLGLPLVSFGPGLVTSLWNGDLKWHNSVDPRNISFFMVGKRAPLDTSQKSRFLALHLQDKNSTCSSDDVASSTKQKVRVPENFVDFLDQLRHFLGLCSIIFGNRNKLVESLENLVVQVKNMEEKLTVCGLLEDRFFGAFGYAIDLQVQEFIKDCGRKMSRRDVDESLLDFSVLLNQVRFNQFRCHLPPSFSISDGKTKRKTDEPTGGEPDPKRLRLNSVDEGESKRIVNSSPCSEFKLRDGESWEKVWCGVTEPRPKWGKARMCARWHIRQYCFKNCRNKESHVPCERLPPTKKAEFKKWMATVRQASEASQEEES